MNINSYEAIHGKVWCAKSEGQTNIIEEGMIQFDEDTACNLAGPFPGNYAYYRVMDYRDLRFFPCMKLITQAEERQRVRFSGYGMPIGKRQDPAQNEEHLQKRLALLDSKQLWYWQKVQDEYKIDRPTVETPFALYIAGNDDSTWTKFYPTEQTLKDELSLYLDMQPINWHLHIYENGFVFTN